METAATALEDSNLGTLLGQQHEQPQSFWVSHVQIIAGEDAHLRPRIRNIVELLGFNKILEICPTTDDAVKQFNA